jgi:hypothetical protein
MFTLRKRAGCLWRVLVAVVCLLLSLPSASQADSKLGRLTFAKAKAEPAPLEPAAFAQGLNTAASEANAKPTRTLGCRQACSLMLS